MQVREGEKTWGRSQARERRVEGEASRVEGEVESRERRGWRRGEAGGNSEGEGGRVAKRDAVI